MGKPAEKAFGWARKTGTPPNLRGRYELSGEDLRGVREALSLTQSEMAKLIGVAVPTVTELERGKGKIIGPAIKVLALLSWLPEAQRKDAVAYLILSAA